MTSSVAEPVSRSFSSSGLTLRYLEWGAATSEPVILLHGTRDHARSWEAVAQALCDRYRVIALDLRGHGDSQWSPDGAYLVPYHLEDLVELVDHLGAGKVSLVGHSFSGNAASRFAALYPERMNRLAIIDGFGPAPANYASWAEEGPVGRTADWIAKRRAFAAAAPRRMASPEEGIARMAQGNPGLRPEQVAHLATHGMRRDGDGYVWKFDPRVSFFAPEDFASVLTEYWRHITAPTLLCYGAGSWSAFVANENYAAGLRTSRLAAIPDAGHWPHHDQPDAFVAILASFLDQPDCSI